MTGRFARAAIVAPIVFGAATLGAQSPAARERARFEITSVGDSTFTFPVGPRTWVSSKDHGDAIDPRNRNRLVARFQVLGVAGGVATALITGETTRLSTQHVALIDEPRRAFYKRGTFWSGVLAGAAAGAGVMAAIK